MLKIKHGGRTSAVQRSARRTRGRYAPINVNPAGGGGVRAKARDLTTRTIPSVGHLTSGRVPGVGTFDFDREAPGSNLQTRLPSSSFSWLWIICFIV